MLTNLNISNNNISGSIPPQLGKAIQLQQLDLSSNHLIGKIPKEFGPLPNIEAFPPFEAFKNNKGLCGNNVTHLKPCSASRNKANKFPVLIIILLIGIDNFSSKQCIDTGRYGTLYKTEMPIENSFLVYEFMEKGSLRNILSNDEEAEKLDWMVRLNAVKGVAKALSYMHHDCSPPIIHRDISSNNVLLDSEYEAHVSDFSTTSREEHELIFFAKLAYKMKVDNKTDVHSFRVVTLEVIMGKHPEELILSLLSSASSSSSSPSTVDHCLLNDVMDQRLPPPVN
ncbi:MDIS1-interacting receptor like kinase 2 [Vitis vinifera]|uniref:non-specific serine/threonine protein kinase n=1 Tax=Vitis vinifera TaxID=29760 RepID=A0A438J6R1_VITVI|nr:MDIS1-interacting receptor like kinase 2 [Vitis vinifera]